MHPRSFVRPLDACEQWCWFMVHDWPLTPAELSSKGANPEESRKDDKESRPQVGVLIDGLFCPPDRPDLAWARLRKSIWAWRKLRRARRWARVFRCIPFVRMIAIGNALGYGNCRETSDIDLVIVTAPRRIWFVRFVSTGLLRLLRQRPGEHGRDALCPSFFLTTEAMQLASLQLPLEQPVHLPSDPYLLWWVTQWTVLDDVDGTYDAFWRANSSWVRSLLPDAWPRGAHPRIMLRKEGRGMRRLWERMLGGAWGDALERWTRHVQEHRFPAELRALLNCDSRVIANNQMLKFHVDDRRAEFRAAWVEHLGRYA